MIVYRASELGGCTKFLVLKRLGYEQMSTPEAFQSKVFDAGKDAEKTVLGLLDDGGEEVLERQREVNIQITDEIVLQGHLDGVMGGRVLEIKSMADGEYKKFEARRWDTPGLVQRYKWQVSSYILATGLECLVLVYNRDTGEIRREGVELPFYSLQQIRERIEGIENWVGDSKIPTQCDIVNYPCPFYYLHEDEEVEEDGELEGDAWAYLALRDQEATIKTRLDALRTRLIGRMDGRAKVKAGQTTLNLSNVRNRRFDVNKARADGVEVDKYYVEQKSQRLTVKEIKADADTDDSEGDS